MNTPSAFPLLPDFGAHARTVFWEPIYGSGERIAIIIATKSLAEWRVQPVVGKATWQCFLGGQAKTATRLVELICSSLEKHLSNGHRLENWTPPLSGVIAAETRYVIGRDMTQVIRTVMRDTCSFAVLPQGLDFDDDVGEDDSNDTDRWPTQVMRLVVDRRPRLAGFFGRKITVKDNARATQMDYAGERYCANFAKLLPDIRLGHWVGKAKIKLLDLEQVRGHAASGELFIQEAEMLPQFELILYRPSSDDPGYTEKAMNNLDKAVVQLEDFADSHEMRLVVSQTAQQAADRLLEKEAA